MMAPALVVLLLSLAAVMLTLPSAVLPSGILTVRLRPNKQYVVIDHVDGRRPGHADISRTGAGSGGGSEVLTLSHPRLHPAPSCPR